MEPAQQPDPDAFWNNTLSHAVEREHEEENRLYPASRSWRPRGESGEETTGRRLGGAALIMLRH
jgi:hypothetical protein